MGEFMITEWKLFGAGDFKVDAWVLLRGFTRHPNHLVRYVDAGHVPVESIVSNQTRRPSRATANVQHPRIRRDPHPRNRLFTSGPMALLHALALPSARPFIEFGSELLVHALPVAFRVGLPPDQAGG